LPEINNLGTGTCDVLLFVATPKTTMSKFNNIKWIEEDATDVGLCNFTSLIIEEYINADDDAPLSSCIDMALNSAEDASVECASTKEPMRRFIGMAFSSAQDGATEMCEFAKWVADDANDVCTSTTITMSKFMPRSSVGDDEKESINPIITRQSVSPLNVKQETEESYAMVALLDLSSTDYDATNQLDYERPPEYNDECDWVSFGDDVLSSSEDVEITAAVVIIQRNMRGAIARDKVRLFIQEIYCTFIQSKIRGFIARNRIQRAALRVQAQQALREIACCTLIQSNVRGFIVRNRIQRAESRVKARALRLFIQEIYCTLIQSNVRGFIVRNRILRAASRVQAQALKYAAYCTLIQSNVRGFIARNRIQRAASRVQEQARKDRAYQRSIFRGSIVRNRMTASRIQAQALKDIAYCTLIQRNFRGFSVRNRIQSAASRIQAQARKDRADQRSRNLKFRKKIRLDKHRNRGKIQSFAPGSFDWEPITRIQRAVIDCATRIQRAVRLYLERKHVRLYLERKHFEATLLVD
jgi:hypothetical protein